MAIIICPACGGKVSSTRTTCGHCGYDFQQKICPECEEKIDSAVKECPVCGYQFACDPSTVAAPVIEKENKLKKKILLILLWGFLGFTALAYLINMIIALNVGGTLGWMFDYITDGYIAGFICMGVGFVGFVIALIILFINKNASSVKTRATAISLMVALLFVIFEPLIFYDPLRYERKDGPAYSVTYCYRNSVSVTVPSNYGGVPVTEISDYVFANHNKLTSVTLPDSIVSIGKQAFYLCRNLTNVSIPNSVTSVGEAAFAQCNSLNHITIGTGITAISSRMFEFSALTSVEIPSSVTTIGSNAFYGCSNLTSIEIPSSVTTIEFCAFSGCSSLTSVVIPHGVTTIDRLAFEYCNALTSVEIPTSVTTLGGGLFGNCSNLKTIKYRGSESQWLALTEEVAWDWCLGDYTIIYDYTAEL